MGPWPAEPRVGSSDFVPLHPRFHPAFFLASAFAAGIALGRFLPPNPVLWGIVTAGVGFLGLSLRQRRAFIPLILSGYALAGVFHLHVVQTQLSPTGLRALYERGLLAAGESARVIGRLVAPVERAPGRVYLDIETDHVMAFGNTYCTRGRLRVMVLLPDEATRTAFESLGLRYGRRLHALVRISRPERYRNPGSPDYDEYLEWHGYDLAAVSKSPLLIEPLESSPLRAIAHAADCPENQRSQPSIFRESVRRVIRFGQALGDRILALLSDAREMWERELDRVFERAGLQTAGLVQALLLGNRHFLDARAAEAFRAGGTFHLLVISGWQVGLLAGVIWGIICWFTRRPLGRVLGTALPILGYALLIGNEPPVWRATVMVMALLGGMLLFRRAPAANSLGIAALVLLVVDPRQLFSPSFQLSFLATGSLALLVAPLLARLQAVGAWRPTPASPHPPSGPEFVRRFAECLFWNERAFQREQAASPIRFRLEKSELARALNQFRVQPLVRAVAGGVLVSLVVQLTVLPLQIEYFHRVTVIGILLNVLLSVLVALLGLVAVLAWVISLLNMPWAMAVAELGREITHLAISSSELALRLPRASFRVPDLSGSGALVYLVYWIALLYFAYRLHAWNPLAPPSERSAHPRGRQISAPRRPLLLRAPAAAGVALLFILCLWLLIAHPFRPASPEGWLALHFLDVGHGDAMLIEFPNGTTMLLDAGGEPGPFPSAARRASDAASGGNSTMGDLPGALAAEQEAFGGELEFIEDRLPIGEIVVSNFLWARGLRRIDYLVPTHADADHLRGFLNVLRNFDVGCVLLGRSSTGDPLFAEFMQEVQRQQIPIVRLMQGDRLRIGDVVMTILWPPPREPEPEMWENRDSLVLRLQYGEISILLTGDIERAAEEALLRSGWELRSDVLKVPHHGSRTSSSEPFLDRVRPRWAIISASDPTAGGRFRYPHLEVRQRYEQRGISLFHTGQQGMITLLTDGRTVRFRLLQEK